ncbi:MAG TPA: DUF4157 domain-containing protein [Vicinamibacterales bacterium]
MITVACDAARKKSEPSQSGDATIRIQRRFDSAVAGGVAPSVGNQQMQAWLRPQPQSTFVVSDPGDASELEAERIAGEIVGSKAPATCSPGQRCECETCVQRRTSEAGAISADGTSALNSHGRPLDDGTRAFFEPRFGQDLSDVRIHTGHDASRSARALGADAFTVGRDIVFGEGQYAPQTESGKQLVAHELVHTIQQRAASGPRIHRSTANSLGEFLTYVIAGLDIGAIAIHAKSVAETEAPAYAPAGHDYGPENALRHCILAGMLDTWCWRAAMLEIAGGAALAYFVNPWWLLVSGYGALMAARIRLFLMGHEWFGDDGCGNYGTATIDSECDRHNNEVGLGIGGPLTSDGTVISESKAALDGGRLWMAPAPTMLTYHVSTALWKTSPWMVPTPQQVDCSKVVIK